jgi:hypothetical protein
MIVLLLATVALAGCAVTWPVAVISKNGQILRGTATASLTGGSFEATDGKLTCSGNYDALSESITLNAKVTCNDGRTGFAIVTRDRGLQSGSGRIRLSDGTEADFVFGAAAQALNGTPRQAPPVADIVSVPPPQTRPSIGRTIAEINTDVTPLIQAFKNCTDSAASRLAISPEPAETIVVAAFAACSPQEAAYRNYLLKTLKNVDRTERVITELRKTAREHLILLVLSRRQPGPEREPRPTDKSI